MRALKNGATPRASLLVVDNAPLEQCEEGICVEGPTGGFIAELAKRLPDIEVAQGLVCYDSTVAPNPFDLSACKNLRLASLPWKQRTHIDRILSYLRSLPWAIGRV